MVITFFTFWIIILVILQRYTKSYFDLLYLTFITLIVGSYISYIHPQYFKFTLFNEQYKLTSLHKLIIVDVFIHLLCFLYIFLYCKHVPTMDHRFYLSLVFVAAYMLMINVRNVYNIGVFEMLSVFIVANMLYLIMFIKK